MSAPANALTRASELGAQFLQKNCQEGWIINDVKCSIGASGAATSGHAAYSFTKTGTGVYDVIYPACSELEMAATIYSPALTVTGFVVTAISETAGTATITIHKAGTAAEPASGDYLKIQFRHRMVE